MAPNVGPTIPPVTWSSIMPAGNRSTSSRDLLENSGITEIQIICHANAIPITLFCNFLVLFLKCPWKTSANIWIIWICKWLHSIFIMIMQHCGSQELYSFVDVRDRSWSICSITRQLSSWIHMCFSISKMNMLTYITPWVYWLSPVALICWDHEKWRPYWNASVPKEEIPWLELDMPRPTIVCSLQNISILVTKNTKY